MQNLSGKVSNFIHQFTNSSKCFQWNFTQLGAHSDFYYNALQISISRSFVKLKYVTLLGHRIYISANRIQNTGAHWPQSSPSIHVFLTLYSEVSGPAACCAVERAALSIFSGTNSPWTLPRPWKREGKPSLGVGWTAASRSCSATEVSFFTT